MKNQAKITAAHKKIGAAVAATMGFGSGVPGRPAHTYRAARRNMARTIRSNGGLGRSIPWPVAWRTAQEATAASVRERVSPPEPAPLPEVPAPIAAAPIPEPAPAEAPAPKKPRARRPSAPKPETETPKAPRKAAAKALKPAAEAKPKAAPRKRVVKPAA